MAFVELPTRRRSPQLGIAALVIVAVAVLVFGRTICSYVIDYFWWREMGQVPTWLRMTAYRYLPGLAAWVIVFPALWVAHARGVKHAGERLRDWPLYARISTLALAFVAMILTLSTVDGWTVARYVGGKSAAASAWTDPVFGKALPFYFFDLPFYSMLLSWVASTAFVAGVVYYVAARGWQLKRDMPGYVFGQELDLRDLGRLGRLETGLLKGLAALFLVALAAQFWLGRYELLLSDHGNLMVGIDYLQQNLGLPLQTIKAGAAVLAALLVIAGRRKLAIACAIVLVIDWIAPRELDLNQLGDARNRWINRALTFTHGYGFVMAEANRISETGLPQLLVLDAPVEVKTKSLKVGRPEIYYGETMDETVFVHTAQPEFNYPSGSSEVNTSYDGKGGFPMSSIGMRTLATAANGDWNILLTNSLTADSRMMIHRKITERVSELAPFLSWDGDPYLVTTADGRLVWILDGYTTSESHPYSRDVAMEDLGRFNYIRNSIKATIDAYDGDVHLYIFDTQDPLITAYQHLFPELFSPVSAMPAGLREHTRAPEMLFRAQAEIYRTYHMRDPESYYN